MLKGATAGVGFALNLILVRALGAEQAGVFFVGLSVVIVLAVAARAGLDQWVTRSVARALVVLDWLEINQLYYRTFISVSIFSLISAALLWMTAPYLAKELFDLPELGRVLKILAFSIPAFSLVWLQGHYFQGMGKVVWFQSLQNLGIHSLLVLLLFISASFVDPVGEVPLVTTAWFYTAVCWGLMLLGIVRWLRQSDVSFDGSCVPWRGWLIVAPTLWGVALVNIVMAWGGQLLLGALATPESVAVYTVALRTSMLLALFLMGINAWALPKFSALYSAGKMDELRHLAVWSARVMLLLALPFAVIMLLWPGWIMSLFGDEFLSAGSVLVVLVVGQLVNVATGSVGGLLTMSGHEKAVLGASLVSVISMLLLCIILAPSYGAMGAAVAQAISLSLQMLILTVYVRRYLGFMPINFWSRV